MPLRDDERGKTLTYVVILEEPIQAHQVCEKLEGKYFHLSINALLKKNETFFSSEVTSNLN